MVILGRNRSIRSQHHSFNNVVFDFIQAQQFWDRGINFDFNVIDFIEGPLRIHWNRFHVVFQQFRNIDDINPESSLLRKDLDIEGHKLVIGCIVDPLLNSFDFSSMVWPIATKVLPIDRKLDHLWEYLLDVIVYLFQVVVKFTNEISGVVEGLSEILAWILTLDGNFLAEEVRPPSIPDNLFRAMNGKVRSMNLLRCHPQDLCIIMTLFLDHLDELVPG